MIRRQSILLFLLFLMGMNFYNKFYVFFLAFFAISIISISDWNFSIKALQRVIVLLLFSATYIYIYQQYNALNIVKIIVLYSFPIMYLLGYKLGRNGIFATVDYSNNEYRLNRQDLMKPVWMVVIGLSIHGTLNFITNPKTAVYSGINRATIDFWTKNEWILTGQISLFILLAGCSYYIIACMDFKKNGIFKSFLLFLLVSGLLYNIIGATRTVLYAAALSLVLGACISILHNGKNPKKVIGYILSVASLVIFLVILYNYNAFGVRSWFENTPLMVRINQVGWYTQSDSIYSRNGQIAAALAELPDHLWGGGTMRLANDITFIHNTWLNIIFMVGIIPAFLFLVYCIWCIAEAAKYAIHSRDEENASLIVGLYSSSMVYLWLEPVCEAVPSFITLFCFISGFIFSKMEENWFWE